MRIVSDINTLVPYNPGKATMIIDTIDDLWHLYNIIQKGDLLQTKVTRKVAIQPNNENKKKSTSSKKQFFVTIKVETIDYDMQGDEIRINGKNVYQNEYISVGQYQSAFIRKTVKFSLVKRSWDPFHLDTLNTATNPTLSADLAIVLMEEGLCNIYLVSSHMILNKAKIELSIPKKRKGPSQYENSMQKFFNYTFEAIVKFIDFSIVKCVVIGSPGFVKDQFSTFLNDKASVSTNISNINSKNNNNNVINFSNVENIFKNKGKFVYTHTSSGNRSALNELLSKKDVLSKIKDTKAAQEIELVNKFDEVLGKNHERVAFGLKSVEIAIEHRAIDFILLTDDFLRKMAASTRKTVQKHLTKAENDGGFVQKLSSMLPTGEKVNNLGGIVAVLKFAVKEIDEIDDFEEEVIEDSNEEEDNDDDLNNLMNEVDINKKDNKNNDGENEEESYEDINNHEDYEDEDANININKNVNN